MHLIFQPFHCFAWLLLGLVTLGNAQADTSSPAPAMVRAVLFLGPDCTECDEVIDFLLPSLVRHYGGRLEIAAFDTSQPGGASLLQSAVAAGTLEEPAVLPTVLVGGQVFTGLMGIAMHLGDDLETVATIPGASRWPELQGLEERLPQGLSDLRERLASAPGDEPFVAQAPGSSVPDRIANGLAVVVLVVMVLALVHSLVRVRRPGRQTGVTGALITAVVLVGLGVSAYTSYTSLAGIEPMCGPVGSCATVQNSEYAKLFGIPMGVLGLFGYSAILITWLAARRLSPIGGAWRWLPWALSLFGVVFSIRLTALEPFVIGHTCLWCLGSAITITAALWLLSGETRGPVR